MNKPVLLTSAAILFLAFTSGQKMIKSNHPLPRGGNKVVEYRYKLSQAPFSSWQESSFWMTNQTLPHQQRMKKTMGHRDYRTNTTMTGKTPTRHELSAGVDTAWVRHYTSGLGASWGAATAIAIDDSGNVYVTGNSYYFRSGYDYLTVKYNPAGIQRWVARYNGPGNAGDYATTLAVDGAGNVYVTGGSENAGTASDFATVKYNSEGVEQWVARYNGPGNADDWADALAVDASGNVCVTGTSAGLDTVNDFVTVKYNSTGVQQWVARYNGPGNAEDGAIALALDASGNVFVTGSSEGSGTGSDFVTVKYGSAGAEQWVARYNGPGNAGDNAYALEIDSAGYVYVTGSSEGIGTELDFATVKYNSIGVQQWTARYNGPINAGDRPSALAVDTSGNVYVTGSSAGLIDAAVREICDYATVKYNSDGVEQWVTRYTGQEQDSGFDYATDLAVDGSGNVYVTGTSDGSNTQYDFATVKYNSAGAEQWVARYNGPEIAGDIAYALAVDASGYVYVTGQSWNDYATIKYNSDGIEQWVAHLSSQRSGHDEAIAMAVDASGNVYVMGTSDNIVTLDYAIIKYNSTGDRLWVARYMGAHRYVEAIPSLAVDGSGNVYVAGTKGEEIDYVTIKYSSAGVQQWVVRYNGPGNGVDRAAAMAVDGSGNLYVTGSSEGSGTYGDYATIKYNSEGVEQWVARYHGPGNANDDAKAITVDTIGNVYVTGKSGGPGTYYDYATIKYNSAGLQRWVARYNGPGNHWDWAEAIAVDATGNGYVTGHSWDSGIGNDYTTIKYNSDGIEQWIACYNGPGNAFDWANDLTVDASGNVYVTGQSHGSDTDYDYATVKYNSAGAEQWIARYNGQEKADWQGTLADNATALAVDASGNVYVTGQSHGSDTDYDYATVKYNSDGIEQWVARYNGPGNSKDWASALAIDASGNIYVSGTSKADGWSVYTTIKYIQTPVSVEKEEPGRPGRYWLAQNYPNPFNPSTTIEFALPKPAFVSLKIYNLLGEEVATLLQEQKAAGVHRLNWNARGVTSGVYVYRLVTDNGFVQIRTLLMLK